ncbi:2407_t:CDS:2, partial [Dentiscutata heterogama]
MHHSSINDNEDDDLNTISIAECRADASNEFSKMEDQEAEFDNSSFNEFLANKVGASSEIEDQEAEFDSSSFTNFLKEIDNDYKIGGLQLQQAFD